MNLKSKAFVTIFLILLLLFSWGTVWGSAETEVNWPKSPLTGVELGPETQLHELIAYLYGWGVGMGGLLAFGILIFAGIQYLISTGNPIKTKEAMNRIASALLGLALLLSSFIILNIINPELTRIRPVDRLIKEMEFEIEGIDPKAMEETSCRFVRFYPQEELGGNPREEGIGYITEGLDDLNILSIAGFREMTGTEIEMYYDKDTEEFPEKTPDGREIVYKDARYYIQGGSCTVTPYEASGWWFWYSPCGSDLSTIHIPVRGIRGKTELQRALYPGTAEKKVNCLLVENIGEGSSASVYDEMPEIKPRMGHWACGSYELDPCETDGIRIDNYSDDRVCGEVPATKKEMRDVLMPIEEEWETWGDYADDVGDPEIVCPVPLGEKIGMLWCCPPEPSEIYGPPVCEGSVSSPYGQQENRFHSGIDIAAPAGTPIYAPADGKVMVIETGRLGGLYMNIDHGGGYVTRYVHLLKQEANMGDEVKRGDLIARVGGVPSDSTAEKTEEYLDGKIEDKEWQSSNTRESRNAGRSTGAHLHYEVRYNGETQNVNDSKFGVCGEEYCKKYYEVTCDF